MHIGSKLSIEDLLTLVHLLGHLQEVVVEFLSRLCRHYLIIEYNQLILARW